MEKTREGEIRRETKETDVFVKIDLDGSGKCSANTGIGFLDHMIQQLSSHGLFDIEVRANGDTHIDDHPSISSIVRSSCCFMANMLNFLLI